MAASSQGARDWATTAKPRASPTIEVNSYPMVEQPAQTVDDRKPKAETAMTLLIGTGKPIELAKYCLSLIVRNAGTAVPYFEAQKVSAPPAADRDPAAHGISERIGHQVQENSLEQNRVAAHPRAARHDPQRQPSFPLFR
jgi:hypothetical protein